MWHWENIGFLPVSMILDFLDKLNPNKKESGEQINSVTTLNILKKLIKEGSLPPRAHAAALNRINAK